MTSLTKVQSEVRPDVKLVVGYQDILWLAGQVFLWSEFVARADKLGLDAVYARCPYGDLTDEQRQVFRSAFHHPRLREVVRTWWETYEEAGLDRVSEGLSASSYQDLARLVGLVVLRRGFVAEADAKGLDYVFAHEIAYGDLTERQEEAFRAAFHDPRLRAIIRHWWAVYDEVRAEGGIISPFEYWNPLPLLVLESPLDSRTDD